MALVIWSIGIPITIFILGFIKPLFLPRYLVFIPPGIVFLLIYLISRLAKKHLVFLGIFLLLINLFYNYFIISIRKKTDIRTTAMTIKPLLKKNDVVYVNSELDFFTAAYYLSYEKVFIYGKSYSEIPAYIGKVLIPETKLRYVLPTYPIKAFIIEKDANYVIQSAL